MHPTVLVFLVEDDAKLFKDHPHLGVRGATIELVEMLSPPGQ
jgi:hypothetical protein